MYLVITDFVVVEKMDIEWSAEKTYKKKKIKKEIIGVYFVVSFSTIFKFQIALAINLNVEMEKIPKNRVLIYLLNSK